MKNLQEIINFFYKKNNNKTFNIIQVGANDGVRNDHLYEFINKNNNINGFLIEPIPFIFEKLKENYKNNKNNLSFLNFAIFNNDSEISMYKIDEKYHDEIRKFYKNQESYAITSIYKEHIHNFLLTRNEKYFKNKNIDNYVSSFKVKTKSFKSIIKENDIKNINLLQIDVEGYDCKLLKNFFDTINIEPDVINFEHKHSNKGDYLKIKEVLEKKGYNLLIHGGDTCAYK
jgi:FkbM family methyltransferase